MIRVGDIEIHIINDGRILADTGGLFGLVPRALWSRYYQADEQSRVPNHHHCLLVRAGGRRIVVDTGLGRKVDARRAAFLALERPDGDLVDGLARKGVQPADVDLVINTHLHGDHCGGNTFIDADGSIQPAFPNAEYWVQRFEYADALFPNERTRGTYFVENYVPLYESGRLRLIDGDLQVAPGMRLVLTPGHTRAHMSVTFEQDGQAVFYLADLATQMIHFARLGWMTAYDTEPLVTLETKRTWQRWVLERDALVINEHDAATPIGRLVQENGENLAIVAAENSDELLA
jgi:glyoxylase-like metal-dependent hydrolase (beta-lactamase superfamily II)